MREEFSRAALLLGEEALQRLGKAHVAVFGVGGVGSFCCEALARAGIGSLQTSTGRSSRCKAQSDGRRPK